MRLRVDRMCKVWQRGGTSWSWRCCVCTSEVLLFTGTARSWERAYAEADHHIRTSHQHQEAATVTTGTTVTATIAPVPLRPRRRVVAWSDSTLRHVPAGQLSPERLIALIPGTSND